MKITIPPTQREQLKKFRAALVTFASDHSKGGKKLAQLTERQQNLQADIAALEAANDDSEAAAGKLATKRVQLEQVGKQLDGMNSQEAIKIQVGFEDKGRDLLRQFAQVATAATMPAIECYRREVAEKIRPYCNDDRSAEALAYQAPAVISLTQTYTYPFGNFGFNVNMLKAAINRVDELLAGELNWIFNAGK